MLCQACKERSATIHLTEINHGQRNETHLCPECARQQGLSGQAQIPLNELLNTLLSTQKEKAGDETTASDAGTEQACPVCGMTLKRFAKEPLLGCPHDYTEFQAQLLPLIEQSHNGKNYHCGKVPARTNKQDRHQIELAKLRRELDKAIQNEDYEAAAALRDQIKELE